MSMKLFSVAAALTALVGIAVPSASVRDLTFEERAQAQEAIERVYYSHQIGADLPFEERLTRPILAAKVRTYLRQSAALEQFWNTPITAEMLSRELSRIERESQMPGRLEELYAALGDDSFLVQECLARTSLVERLSRRFFALDARIHGAKRSEAEDLHRRLVDAEIDTHADHVSRSVFELIGEPTIEIRDPRRTGRDGARLIVSEDEMRRWRKRLPSEPGQIGALEETEDGFLTWVVLAELNGGLRVAGYFTPKTTWDEWWTAVGKGLDEISVRAVASEEVLLGAAPCLPDGTWSTGDLGEHPQARYNHTAVWTGSEMIVWGGYNNGYLATGGRYDPAVDAWFPISNLGAPSARTGHTAVWTGSEMIVWGGQTSVSSFESTGGRYDPATDTWEPTSTSGAPSRRGNHTAVWTGSLMVVVGGEAPGDEFPQTMGRYDPAADHWLPTGLGTKRADHTAVWNGSRVIVWGGRNAYLVGLDSGGQYDPVADSWTQTSGIQAPSRRCLHTAVWTGFDMIVWGGIYNIDYLGTGARYNPYSDTWSPISTFDAPAARFLHTAVWAGRGMVVWGGRDGAALDTGGVYYPLTDSWASTSLVGAPSARTSHTAVFGDGVMVVWGGVNPPTDTGGRYNPVSDTWTPTTTTSTPTARVNHSAIWTGKEMIVWGGGQPLGFNSGGRFNPVTNSWTPTATAGAPDHRGEHSAVWTGNVMIIWGGLYSSSVWDTGGLYNPISNTWSATSTTGAPSPRYSHTAVWTGDSMLVWAGRDQNGELQDGARYDPVSDGWRPAASIAAPEGRYRQSAVWTGSRMVIWGGESLARGFLTSGGRYDPISDSWQPMSLQNVPDGRSTHTAVWTGDEMIVWGGIGPSTFDTGGRYDPATDIWLPTSTSSAPAARTEHSGVWSGDRMIVWGGADDGTIYYDDGGLYDPTSDQWTPIVPEGAPAPRKQHEAVWTGSLMIVWGGADETNYLRTGAAYARGHEVDNDGDGFDECNGDCDDLDSGSHPGAAEICDGLDNDCDGTVDNAAGPPLPTVRIHFTDSSGLRWGPTTGAGAYDVVKGDLSAMVAGGGDFAASLLECLRDDESGLDASDTSVPPGAGAGYYYLARAVGCGENGSYDSQGPAQQDSRDAEIDQSPLSCP